MGILGNRKILKEANSLKLGIAMGQAQKEWKKRNQGKVKNQQHEYYLRGEAE